LVVLLGTVARIHTASSSPHFDRADPRGMLVTDPGLLYYLTERVVESGGLPGDFAAEPRIEHPEVVDVTARFTVGQELLVLAARRLVGEEMPLHVVCVWLFALVASAAAVGVFGLAFELTRSMRWASLAAVVFALLPVNYRTIGFVLMREDLAWPLFALHLWLAARALRRQGAASGLLAGVSLGLACASWHAMGMVAAVEALAIFTWFLHSGHNPFAHRGGRFALLGMAVVTLLVPALWAKGAILSLPLQLAGGLTLAGLFAGARPRPWQVGCALSGAALLLVASVALGTWLGTGQDLRHVLDVLVAKISHLGIRPADPGLLSFDARMMWQGPFRTLGLTEAWRGFQVCLLLLPLLLVVEKLRFLRRRGSDLQRTLHLGLLFTLVAAWLVARMAVLAGLLLPVLLVHLGQRSSAVGPKVGHLLGVAALLFWQLVGFGSWLGRNEVPWYAEVRPAEVRAMLEAVDEHVPAGAPVAADFMSSTAILAHTRRPIVMQPKWESAPSRERVGLFWDALYNGSPADLSRLLRERWRTDHILIDRRTLWWNRDSRYLAGLGEEAPRPLPGTAAAALLASGEPLEIEGYRLLWHGPGAMGEGDRYRLYALER